MSASERHNKAVRPLLDQMLHVSRHNLSQLNVLAESLLLGVAMLNFPHEPRKQALLVQAIADGAQDRARGVPDR